jgi:C3HC zinc finger-like
MSMIEVDDDNESGNDFAARRASDDQARNEEKEKEDEKETLEIQDLIKAAATPLRRASKNNDDAQELYGQFKDRMSSFTPAKYFAMPLQVSPLVCAVSGWKMKATSSLLVCTHCEKLLSIKIPTELSASAKRKLCESYQKHLWETHADHCPFRADAKRFLCLPAEQKKKRDVLVTGPPCSLLLPTSLTRLLPQDDPAILSLESAFPRAAFRERVEKLSMIFQDFEVPIQLPLDVSLYRTDDDIVPETAKEAEEAGTASPPTSLVNRILSCCNMETSYGNETAASLALLGWNVQDDNQGIGCTLCLAQRSIDVPLTANGSQQPVSANRSKWNHAFDAHRYFCPWVCGLPGAASTPLWKGLADRLLDDVESSLLLSKMDGTSTIDPADNPLGSSGVLSELGKLLDTGVSRKRLKRSTSWNKGRLGK